MSASGIVQSRETPPPGGVFLSAENVSRWRKRAFRFHSNSLYFNNLNVGTVVANNYQKDF